MEGEHGLRLCAHCPEQIEQPYSDRLWPSGLVWTLDLTLKTLHAFRSGIIALIMWSLNCQIRGQCLLGKVCIDRLDEFDTAEISPLSQVPTPKRLPPSFVHPSN